MAEFKYNKILIVLIIIGLLAGLTINWQRHRLESNNSSVEMVIDYEDVVELAQLEGKPVPDLMKQFKEAGITSLAVYETTLEKLNKNGKVTALSGAQVLNNYRAGTLSEPLWRSLLESNQIKAEDVYIIGRDDAVFAEVQSDLIRRLGKERVSLLDDKAKILSIKANFEKIVKANLGLPVDEMKEVSQNGFWVVARPSNYIKVSEDDVNSVFTRLDAVNNVSGIMFVGEEALGYPKQINTTAENLKTRNLSLYMIEHPLQLQFVKQEGLLPLAALNNYQAARVYVIPKDEQPKLKVEEAVQRWVVTDRERNIRVNLLRKFDKPESGKTLLETNLDYVSGIKNGLAQYGFTVGRAGTFPPFFPPAVLYVLLIVGVTAAGVLYLTLLRPFAPRYQYILLVLIALLLSVPVLKGGGLLARQAAALGSAVIFPALAMIWQLDRWRKVKPDLQASTARILLNGTVSLTTAVAFALVGGLYVASVLADVRFLLEIEIYRGVKLTFVAPLLLVMAAYLARYNLFETEGRQDARGIGKQLIKLLDYPVRLKTLLLFAIAALGAWVFVGRSGHTAGVPVPAIELKFRAFLENVMYARPREKEFLIGHPAFLLAVMAVLRGWPKFLHFALVIVATIGLGSLVETFAHMRSPVFLSFVRALDGLVLGLALGFLAVIGVQVLHYLSYILGRRTARHE